MRAEQLARGMQPFVPVSGATFDPCMVAEQELAAGVMPLIIARRMPDGTTVHLRADGRATSVGETDPGWARLLQSA